MRLVELSHAGSAHAGETVTVRVRLQTKNDITGSIPVSLKLRLGDCVVATDNTELKLTAPTPANSILPPAELNLHLAKFLQSGKYTLDLNLRGYDLPIPTAQQLPTLCLQVTREDNTPTVSSLANTLLPPRLFAREEPVQAMYDVFSSLDAAAIPKTVCVIRFPYSFSENDILTTPANRWEIFDTTVSRLLTAVPGALLVPVINLDAPTSWQMRHPDQLISTRGKLTTTLPAASFSSRQWRSDMATELEALLQHIESGPLQDHFIAYQLAAGLEGRWISPDMTAAGIGDYSRPQQEAFQQWLQKRYQNLANLRIAWGQPVQPAPRPDAAPAETAWQTVNIPLPALRESAVSWLLDPVAHQSVVDYRLFASEAIVDAITHFCTVVKTATKKPCGVAYGHFMELASRHRGLELGGHLALSTLLESPTVDFIVAPPANSDGAVLLPAASIQASGKVLVISRSPALGKPLNPVSAASDTVSYKDIPGIQMLAAEQSAILCAPYDFNEMPPYKTQEPANESGIAQTGLAQIAVVVDDQSCAWMAQGNPVKKSLLFQQMSEIRKLGAPVDVWLLQDILRNRAPVYKMYIILTFLRTDPEDSQRLALIASRSESTWIWLCAPGATEGGLSGRQMKQLTGIGTAAISGKGPLTVKLEHPVSPWTSGLRLPLTYGLNVTASPCLVVVDPATQTLGRTVDGHVGLAIVKRDKGQAIFSSAPCLPAALIRAFCETSGIHLYSNNPVSMFLRPGYLGITNVPDMTTITFPQPARLSIWPGNIQAPGSDDTDLKSHRLQAGEYLLQ